jgi:hypothetical protein
MKGPDRAPSSFKLPAATGLVLLRHSGLELVRPLQTRLATSDGTDFETEAVELQVVPPTLIPKWPKWDERHTQVRHRAIGLGRNRPRLLGTLANDEAG